MTSAPSASAPPLATGDVGLDAWKALLLANARLMQELDEELRAAHGLALGDYDVLVQLGRTPDGRLRMCDLASAVLLSPSGLSRRVDRLERSGLVKRGRGEADRRNIEAGLTAAGKRFFRRARATHLAGIQRLFVEYFSPEELATLRDLLGRLPVEDKCD